MSRSTRLRGTHARRVRGARVVVATLLAGLYGCGDGVGPLDFTVFQTVSAGVMHTCAIDVDGVVYCWGLADGGALGDGGTGTRGYAAAIASDARFVALSAGNGHTCAIATDDALYCWGSNAHGQIGDGSTADQPLPVRVGGGLRFARVSSGVDHTCGVTTDNETYCWGANADGQLGDGTTADRSSPVRVSGPTLTRIEAGGHHTCGLNASGSAFCWGRNDQGQLGSGTTARSVVPVAVRGGRRYRQIAAGVSHTCAINRIRHIFCWGSNGSGELGLHLVSESGEPGRLTPDRVTTDIRNQQYSKIAAGHEFTCATDTRRHAYCWGRGQEGQLGTGSTRTWEWPRAVYPPPIPRGPGASRFHNVSTGATHACGTTTRDVILCWGTGDAGQLGNPGVWETEIPVRVAGVRR